MSNLSLAVPSQNKLPGRLIANNGKQRHIKLAIYSSFLPTPLIKPVGQKRTARKQGRMAFFGKRQ
jgi:hypothetical protein